MTTAVQEPRGRFSTRQALIDAAARCFEQAGFSATSMDDVAAAAGTSRQTVYKYFDNKQTLVVEVLAHRAAAIVDQLRSEVAFRTPTLEVIGETAVRHLELTSQDLIGRRLSSPQDAPLIARCLVDARMIAVRRSFWVPLLQAAADQGIVRDDLDIEDTANWLIFLLFSLGNHGDDFGLTGERRRAAVRHYLTSSVAKT